MPSQYQQSLGALETRRLALAAGYQAGSPRARAAVLGSARTIILGALRETILPAWAGTPWDFYGTSEEPRQGSIACGYFVSTVLRDAGFRLDRGVLARQASERIVRSFAPESRILRFRGTTPAGVVEAVKQAEGDGLYLVGLDYHAAMLLIEGERADLCHSAWYAGALCEPAVASKGMESDYYVVGPALDEPRLRDWLLGTPVPLAPPRRLTL